MKTLQEKKNDIRAKCIEANPSIKDLVFGCDVQDVEYSHKWKYVGRYSDDWLILWKDDTGTGKARRENIQIIGRPIQLADVLLAIGNNTDEGIYILDDGTFADREDIVLGDWNLLKPFSEQEEPVIRFIHELLHG